MKTEAYKLYAVPGVFWILLPNFIKSILIILSCTVSKLVHFLRCSQVRETKDEINSTSCMSKVKEVRSNTQTAW